MPFADWLGPKGRSLTPAGNVRPADAGELIALLGTGDEDLRFRSAAELPGPDLIVNWAKKARLVRRQGAGLVPVAKARPVLADAEDLGYPESLPQGCAVASWVSWATLAAAHRCRSLASSVHRLCCRDLYAMDAAVRWKVVPTLFWMKAPGRWRAIACVAFQPVQ